MLDARAHLDQGLIFERSGHLRRALESYEYVAATTVDPALRAEALRHQSEALRLRCEWEPALAAARRSAEVAKSFGLSDHFAEARNAEAIVHQRRGDFDAALPLLREIVGLPVDDRIRGLALQNLGSIAAMRREFEAAQEFYAESRLCFAHAGYLRGETIALSNEAAVANIRGDFGRALEAAEQAMDAAVRLDDSEALAHASVNAARAMAALGRMGRAEELISTALGYFTVEENAHGRIACLRILGDINLERGERSLAKACFLRARQAAEPAGALDEVEQLDARLARMAGGV